MRSVVAMLLVVSGVSLVVAGAFLVSCALGFVSAGAGCGLLGFLVAD